MMVVAAPQESYSEIIRHSYKRKKRCEDCMSDISKLTFLIYGLVPSPDQCKVPNKFLSRYAAFRPSKEVKHELTTQKNLIKQEVKYVVHHAVYDILKEDDDI